MNVWVIGPLGKSSTLRSNDNCVRILCHCALSMASVLSAWAYINSIQGRSKLNTQECFHGWINKEACTHVRHMARMTYIQCCSSSLSTQVKHSSKSSILKLPYYGQIFIFHPGLQRSNLAWFFFIQKTLQIPRRQHIYRSFYRLPQITL